MDETQVNARISQVGAKVAMDTRQPRPDGLARPRPWRPPVVTRLRIEQTLFLAGSRADAFSPTA